jgi:hypothetical protein
LRRLEELRKAISVFDRGAAPAGQSQLERAEKLRSLLQDYTQFQKDLSRTEARLLRRLFDKVSLSDIHRAYLDTDLAERAIEQAAASAEHLKRTLGIQQNLEVFELLILAVYAFELAHQFLERPFSRLAERLDSRPWAAAMEAAFPLLIVGVVLWVYSAARKVLVREERRPALRSEERRSDAWMVKPWRILWGGITHILGGRADSGGGNRPSGPVPSWELASMKTAVGEGLRANDSEESKRAPLRRRALAILAIAAVIAAVLGAVSVYSGPLREAEPSPATKELERVRAAAAQSREDRRQFEDVKRRLDEIERSVKAQEKSVLPSETKTPRKTPPVKTKVAQ